MELADHVGREGVALRAGAQRGGQFQERGDRLVQGIAPAREAQLEAAQARLVVLTDQIEELRRRYANKQATTARAAGQPSLPEDQLAEITAWYRGAVAEGITDDQNKRGKIGKDRLRLARRFRDHQDMILRSASPPGYGCIIAPGVQVRVAGG